MLAGGAIPAFHGRWKTATPSVNRCEKLFHGKKKPSGRTSEYNRDFRSIFTISTIPTRGNQWLAKPNREDAYPFYSARPEPHQRNNDRPRTHPLPFEAAPLLSKTDRSFFGVLLHAVRSDFLVLTKANLGDLPRVKSGTKMRNSYNHKIGR